MERWRQRQRESRPGTEAENTPLTCPNTRYMYTRKKKSMNSQRRWKKGSQKMSIDLLKNESQPHLMTPCDTRLLVRRVVEKEPILQCTAVLIPRRVGSREMVQILHKPKQLHTVAETTTVLHNVEHARLSPRVSPCKVLACVRR